LSLAKGGLALFAFDLIRWTSISDPRWNAKLFDYFMIAEFAMKFLTSERSITTVKPRPKRITLAEFARLKLLGATEMAAQPSTRYNEKKMSQPASRLQCNDFGNAAQPIRVNAHQALTLALLRAGEIRKSSICLPAFSKATSHRGCLPRPDHVSEESSGFRYFGITAG
jgi:hypothetical protein